MSLRTGGRVATAINPLINPHNLKVEGWYCEDVFNKEILILLVKDIRDFIPQGIAIDDYDVLSDPKELVRLQEVVELDFEVIGKPVVTNQKRRMGKVSDYALDMNSMLIQKLYVSRPVYKSVTEGQLSIDRTQIIEITNRRVVVRDVEEKVSSPAPAPAFGAS